MLARRFSLSELVPYEERYFASGEGLKLYYRDYKGAKDRTPVLCIPGLTRNSRDFESIAAHMALSRRVLVTDLRGRGKSAYAKDPRRYTVAIEAAGQGFFAGYGPVAMTMAATRPDVLRGVILNDIGGEIHSLGLSRILDFVGCSAPLPDWNTAAQQLKRMHASAFPDIGDARWLGFAHAIYREENGQILPDYDPALADTTRESSLITGPNGPGVPLWPLFSALTPLPTLVLRGENSDLLTASTLEKMHAQKPDLVSAVVQRCGHAPFLDEPAAIVAIDKFLEKTT